MALSRTQGIVAAVVVIAAVAAGIAYGPMMTKKNESKYSVVYLQTGEIYVGKLARFPRLKLTETYLLQNTRDPKDQTKTNLQLIPLSESVWAPTELYLDLSHILFYGPLDINSGAAKALVGSGKK